MTCLSDATTNVSKAYSTA